MGTVEQQKDLIHNGKHSSTEPHKEPGEKEIGRVGHRSDAMELRLRSQAVKISQMPVSELLAFGLAQLPGIILAKFFWVAFSEGRFAGVRKILRLCFNSRQVRRSAELIRRAGLFDERFYSQQLGRGESTDSRLLTHFLVAGARMGLAPHPLFDTRFYVNAGSKAELLCSNPLVHYLTKGWKRNRPPHVLFDVAYYRDQLGCSDIEPLQHFLSSSPGHYLNPNRLFDPNYYAQRNSDRVSSEVNPLIHFINLGAKDGLRCHPLFDAGFYLTEYPDVDKQGWNPLTHYLLHGFREGRLTAPGVDLDFTPCAESPTPAGRVRDMQRSPVDRAALFLVYGARHVSFLKNVFLPTLVANAGRRPVDLHLLNFADNQPLMSATTTSGDITVYDWSASRDIKQIGFGEAHNYLFQQVKPNDCFIVVNPDSAPLKGCLDSLFETYERTSAGIVEARQWPRAHPKEYEVQTGDTPWASGAFALIDAQVFAQIGGFDPVFFLYGEDVDLSWRVWLAGRRVVHEPKAVCSHFTGLYSYRCDRFYHEHFYSNRNFLVLARKFFGLEGEARALQLLQSSGFPDEFCRKMIDSYNAMRATIKPVGEVQHPMIKILGVNLYHFPQPLVQSPEPETKISSEEPVAHVG